MSDTSAIDAALIAVLQNDATLAGLLPDGVFYDAAPAGSQRFAIVSRIPESPGDVATFGTGRTLEDYFFLIKAMVLSTTNGNVRAAAQRIDELLEDQPLVADGFTWCTTYRLAHVRLTEVDEEDPSIRWMHRGGRYRVQMALVE